MLRCFSAVPPASLRHLGSVPGILRATQILRERNMVYDITDGLKTLEKDKTLAEVTEKRVSVYCGFDPTAKALHVGNLQQLVALEWFRRCGVDVIAVIGGATVQVGDPSGRATERGRMESSEAVGNASRIAASISSLFGRWSQQEPAPEDAEGSGAFEIVDNMSWMKELSALDLVGDVFSHFRMSSMLSRDAVRSRLQDGKDGLSLKEFVYQAFQAYDYAHLRKSKDCILQIGGSDQWGNITAGIDLIRRMSLGESFGLTLPLLTSSTGEKIGKSAGNATMWIDRDVMSPFDLYQQLLNTRDAEAGTLLRCLTFTPMDEIQRVQSEHDTAPENRLAQRALASEIVRLLHGEEAAKAAAHAAETLFGKSSDDLASLEGLPGVPRTSLNRQQIQAMTTADLFVSCGAVGSKSEAKRLARSGGLYVNGQAVESAQTPISKDESHLVLRVGRKRYFIVDIQDDD